MNTIIRDASLEDAERILEIYGYYVKNTAITFEYDVPTLPEFQERIKNTRKRYPYLVIEQDGIIQGYAYAGGLAIGLVRRQYISTKPPASVVWDENCMRPLKTD